MRYSESDYENAAGLIDRCLLAGSHLKMVAESQGWVVSDDDVVDVAACHAMDGNPESGFHPDQDAIVNALFDYLELISRPE